MPLDRSKMKKPYGFLEREEGDMSLSDIEKAKDSIQQVVEHTSNQPWPLIDIIKKLIEGNRLLLNIHSYDGHGWELLNQAIDEGEKVIAYIEAGGTIGISEMMQRVHKEEWIPQYMEMNFPEDKSTKHQEG